MNKLISTLIAAIMLIACASVHAVDQSAFDAEKATAWAAFESQKSSAWKGFEDEKDAAWRMFEAAQMQELNKLRSADKPAYLAWLDAKERKDLDAQMSLELGNPALVAYRKAISPLYAKYRATETAAYAKYKASETTAYNKYKAVETAAYKK